jgi:hypothetical protein
VTTMTALPGVAEVRHVFAQSADERDLSASAGEAVAGSGMGALVVPLLQVAQELAEWMVLHEPSGEFALGLSWDERLVLVEARDAGTAVPRPESSRDDVALAMRLLVPPAVEWGAEPTDTGRRLWVALAVAERSSQARQR